MEQIKKEAEVLSILHPKLPSYIKVPKYLATKLSDDYPFVYYKMIPGEPLNKELYNSFTNSKKTKFIQQIVEFLHILHSINIERCKNLEKIDASKNIKIYINKLLKFVLNI